MTPVIFAIIWASLALFLGLIVSKLMGKIHFPNVTGFLITGILIGPFVLGWISQDYFKEVTKNLSWLTEIALGFIAFTIGGSFKKSALQKVGKRAVIISIFEALGGAIIVMIGLFIAYFAGLKNQGLTISMILILGAIACATAPAATLLVINQYRAKGPVTETLIPVVAFDDAVALIAFAILFSISKTLSTGVSFNAVDGILIPLLEIILSLIIGALIGFIISFGTKYFKSRHNRLILIIAGVLLGVGLAQIKTNTHFKWPFEFQFSSLLTVMATGAIYHNFAEGVNTTNEYLNKFTSPIFMMFFIISGANLDFSIFGSKKALLVVGIALIYLITRIIGKWSGSALGSEITKCDPIVKKYLGFALIPQAGVALGLASNAQSYFVSIGQNETGVMIYTIIIISTIIYELSGPLVTKWALTKANEINIENS